MDSAISQLSASLAEQAFGMAEQAFGVKKVVHTPMLATRPPTAHASNDVRPASRNRDAWSKLFLRLS